MVGFALALAGGAARGWGEGQLSAIKATREEKLRQLEAEREDARETRRQSFMANESALSRASQEKLTAAQLASQETLSREERKSREGLTAAQIAANERITKLEIGSREGEGEANRENAKTLQQMQIDAQKDLDIKPVTVMENGKQVTRLMKGDKVIENPIDPNTGKKIDIAIDPENDTPQISNFKYLVGIGADPEVARRLAFDPGTDPAVLKTQLVTTLLKARVGDFGKADDDDTRWAEDQADIWMKNILGAGSEGADAPASPTPATRVERPRSLDDAGLIAEAKRRLRAEGGTAAAKEALKKQLLDWNVSPAALSDAGF